MNSTDSPEITALRAALDAAKKAHVEADITFWEKEGDDSAEARGLEAAEEALATAESNLAQALKPKPTWTHTTRVCDLTEADLDDEVIAILAGPGSRNHWTLRRLISGIRRDKERGDGADETETVSDWLQSSSYRLA